MQPAPFCAKCIAIRRHDLDNCCCICHEPCCFERCGKPATHKIGREVYYPMCDEHARAVA